MRSGRTLSVPRPLQIELRTELPKSPALKILRRELQAERRNNERDT